MGCFPSSRHMEGPSAFRAPHPALTKIFKPVVRVGAGPLWEQGPTKASLSCSTKHHFWVSEVADPGPTPFLLPWATARREAGRPISSPPFWCQGVYSKGKKFQIYTSAPESPVHPGCQIPRATQAPSGTGRPDPPAPLLGSRGLCLPPSL